MGLIPLGLLDSSLLPLPGILDVATIVMSARQQQWWLYYALMATAGSLIGGFVTYRLARKGGKDALERRFSRKKVDKVCEIFGRWGFAAIAIPAVLPPPVPMVPFLLAAGAMQYPARKFLAALALGRISRYLILSYLACALWTPNHRIPCGPRAPRRRGYRHAVAGRGRRDVLFLGREKEQQLDSEITLAFLLKRANFCEASGSLDNLR